MTALLITIYIIGCVVAYILFRHNLKKSTGEWYWGDVIIAVVLSVLFSWLSAAVALLLIGIDALINIDSKPPKWL